MLGQAEGKVLQDIKRWAVNVIRPFVFANWYLSNMGWHPPTETGTVSLIESRDYLFLLSTFQRDGSQVLEKDLPGL